MQNVAGGLVAAAAGLVVTILLAYAGAIVLLVATLGIPLGAEAQETTPAQYAWLLAIAAAASVIGGRVATRVSRRGSRGSAVTLSATLIAGSLWGFTRPGSQWPGWWPPTLAIVVGAGALLGALWASKRAEGP
jgi:hypothetical protein